ncbi:MAG TPA: CPBP family intramembrane glutamic endopeptidase [Gaiellaceae bacterium]|nr:CPBP family intramembrane glutamic endopeptidase [Gaiellaceae bacterium]
MPTTSSPTSRRPSRRRNPAPLVLWLAVSAFLVAVAFWSQSQETAPEDVLYDIDFALNGVVFYGIMIAVAFGIGAFYRHTRRALGFRRFRLRWVWISFGVVVATVIVARILEPVLHGGEEQGFAPDRWQPEHATAFAVNSAVVILVGPFAEELFFRGLGVRALTVFGGLAAILVSGLVFGLVHGILGALPPLALFGIGLAWVRLRSASVWPAFIAHAAYNGLGILLLVLAWATDTPVN